jgi:hypothetical protein
MPITPLTAALGSPQTGLPTGPDKSGSNLQRTPNAPVAVRPAATNVPPADTTPDSTDTVSLSAEIKSPEVRDLQVPVYAEIWKGTVKLAQVDIHGHVSSFTGLVASGGGGRASPLIAAQRAVQVAQQTGGEIRTAGQPLDGQTLLMRARLASTYNA